MINKKQIANLAKQVLRHQQGLRDPQIMHPEREWSIGLAVALLIFLFCMFWSLYTYLANKDVSYEETGLDNNEVVVYRESVVKAALLNFAEREIKLEQLLGNAAPVPPPIKESVEDTSTSTIDELSSSTPDVVVPPEESESAVQ